MYLLLLCCVFISLMLFLPAANSHFITFYSVKYFYFESRVWVQEVQNHSGNLFQYIQENLSLFWDTVWNKDFCIPLWTPKSTLKQINHSNISTQPFYYLQILLWLKGTPIIFGLNLSHWSQGIHCFAIEQKLKTSLEQTDTKGRSSCWETYNEINLSQLEDILLFPEQCLVV